MDYNIIVGIVYAVYLTHQQYTMRKDAGRYVFFVIQCIDTICVECGTR
jgi:hypothetical protein